MPLPTRSRPIIGVLASWQVYEGTTISGYLHTLLQGVCAAARSRRCDVLLACGVGPVSRPGSTIPAWPVSATDTTFVPIGPWNCDGLIVIPPLLDATRTRYLQELRARGFPIVCNTPGELGPGVAVDNKSGIRHAFDHLLDHGHRQIAFVAGYPTGAGESAERLAAYCEAVQACGLELDPRLIVYGLHTLSDGYTATQQLLSAGTPFTAVMASNDTSALGAIRALREAGLRVPEDVAVIGCDDIADANAHTPSLTTIRQPTFALGSALLEMLLDHINGLQSADAALQIPTRLVIRQSCGCHLGARTRLAISSARRLALPGDETDTAVLAAALVQAVIAEATPLHADLIGELCHRLAAAFLRSVTLHNAEDFTATLGALLQHVEGIGDNPALWQQAIAMLREVAPNPPADEEAGASYAFVEGMLDRAYLAISDYTRWHEARLLARQARVADRVGFMSAQLLATLDERHIPAILAEHLPEIGIAHAQIVLFEPPGGDPQGWSQLWIGVSDQASGATSRFLTGQFPPAGLYGAEEPLSLALLPLVVQERQIGFVAFDAANLEPCATIVRQLAAVFRSSQLYREAAEGRRLAEEASRLKSRFLSMVSHELHTPLNLIVGLSQMLLHEWPQDVDAAVREDIERIYASGQHLGRLIGDVLDLARGDAGQLRLSCEPLDLAEVLAPVAATGEQLARGKGLQWQAGLPPSGVQVWGDCTRLRQIALNLIGNAVKFTLNGSVSLGVELAPNYVTVLVSDTGPGVAPQEQQAIFDEFQRSERSELRSIGGMGLGLAICKHLVALHGGTIGVQSDGVTGAVFSFSLPTITGYGAGALPAGTTQRTDDSRERTILLVDDDLDTLHMYARALRSRFPTCQVLTARDGREALTAVQQVRPDLVLLDLVMPGLDGFSTLDMLRACDATRDVPVIVLTAQIVTDLELARMNTGVAAVLEKGLLHTEETLAHITATLSGAKRLAGATQRLMRKAMVYLHTHYGQPVSRDQLAGHVGVSEDYLTQCFHQELGITPMVYLNRYRIRQAKRLLEVGELSVTAVALAVGFADTSYFSRVFQREVGVAPSAYRRGARPRHDAHPSPSGIHPERKSSKRSR